MAEIALLAMAGGGALSAYGSYRQGKDARAAGKRLDQRYRVLAAQEEKRNLERQERIAEEGLLREGQLVGGIVSSGLRASGRTAALLKAHDRTQTAKDKALVSRASIEEQEDLIYRGREARRQGRQAYEAGRLGMWTSILGTGSGIGRSLDFKEGINYRTTA